MRNLFAIILLIITPEVFCQEINFPERITEIAEELAADEPDPGSVEIFSDMLYTLTEDPVKINSGIEKEISRLFFLTDFQVKILADYVRNSGMILSPFEIANIPGFDKETAEMLIPFVTFVTFPFSDKDSSRFKQTLLANFIHKNSIEDTSLLGSQWKILTKYKFYYRSFSGGFTSEKDPGEKYITGSPPLPDFYSGYINYAGRGIIRHIIIGDFSARFGQGTGINTEMRTGLSLSSAGYLSGRSGFRPYTSTDENNFFRGAAAQLSWKKIDLDMFASFNRIDATFNETSDSILKTIKSLYTSGLHTTETSLLKKDAAYETNFGIHLSYNFYNFRTGIILSNSRFSHPFMPDLSDPANRFDFAGIENSLCTIYYNGIVKRSIIFGELSVSGQNRHAVIQGISFRPASRLNVNLMYRNYSSGFVTFHGKGGSGSAGNSNEYGLLGNFTFEAARFLFISAGTDLRYYPWLRYRCSSPSMSEKYEIRLKYFPAGRFAFETIYSNRSAVSDNNGENMIPGQQETITKSLKGSVKFSPTEYVTFITRADYKKVFPSGDNGVNLLQDINLKMRRFPVSIWFRYSIFNTGGYESGIYTWENDLLSSFNIPVLYGNGSRSYIMTCWKVSHRGEFRIKYGTTSSYVSGSRNKNINEFRIQFRINL
jgi:hypothetical protein